MCFSARSHACLLSPTRQKNRKTIDEHLSIQWRLFVAPFFSMFLPKIGESSLLIILVSALFAIVNGTMEELLWRGTFVTAFPKSWLWSYLYPSIWFGYWHLSPQVIFSSQMPGGAFGFATMSIFMGLTFGWIAKKTKSIRWTAFAHILTDFMGLAGFAFIRGGY